MCPCGQGRATACVRTRSSPWWSSTYSNLNEEQGHNVIVFVASEFTHGQMVLCGWAEGLIWEQRDKAEGLFVGASV